VQGAETGGDVMASLELTLFGETLTKHVRAAIDKVIREYADEGVLMFPYCPDCRTLMRKKVAFYKDDAYPVWECECSLDGLHDLIEDELS